MRINLEEKYQELLSGIEEIDDNLLPSYVSELTLRHRKGRRIPSSTYVKWEESLYYKKSLGRNSPYYVDLLKLEDKDLVRDILEDICKRIRIKSLRR